MSTDNTLVVYNLAMQGNGVRLFPDCRRSCQLQEGLNPLGCETGTCSPVVATGANSRHKGATSHMGEGLCESTSMLAWFNGTEDEVGSK